MASDIRPALDPSVRPLWEYKATMVTAETNIVYVVSAQQEYSGGEARNLEESRDLTINLPGLVIHRRFRSTKPPDCFVVLKRFDR